MNTNQLIFREDQRVRNPILWITLVVVSSGLMGTALWMAASHFQTRSAPNTPQPVDTMMIGLALTVFILNGGFLLLVALLKMQVEVTTQGLFVRFRPLQFKTRRIDLADVTNVAAVQYHPVMDYGGYGIRKRRTAKAFNLGGRDGVRIDYDNGFHIMIGTRHPDSLEASIQHLVATAQRSDEE
jgi:hypothetical protein